MFVNKLSQVYKPKRVLYYIDADEALVKEFYKGHMPEIIGRFHGAFGTYDEPGVFYLDRDKSPVIGIEFRVDDDRIDYPGDLKSTILKGAYFYAVELDNEEEINCAFIDELFAQMSADDDAHRLYTDLYIRKENAVIAVFATAEKIRIMHEWDLVQDRAGRIINGRVHEMDAEKLYHMAFFDPITGHYNWNHLSAFLENPMDGGFGDYAFVHFDVKYFRVINEVYGHVAANKVLRDIVKAMNESDFVYASARCHNDNFAMIIKDMPAEEMRKKLEEFFDSISTMEDDPSYRVYYRCGVVPMQRAILNGNRVADAAKSAQAMGTRSNRTDITFYTDEMHEELSWGNFIKAYLDIAIKNDEFEVYLQPKINSDDDTLCGAEALVRWNYKKRGMLPPGRFVPFFERDGSIGKIDDIVLRKVSETLAKWKNEGKNTVPVSVNLSRSRLNDNNLTETLTGIVDRYDVDHELIDFELTESAAYDNTEHLMSVLAEMRTRGFKISMDDFGTGYSSFALLTQMPLDTLKIDKTFVDKIAVEDEKAGDISVIKHIIALARELNVECLAEGAERQEQVNKLRGLGCKKIQGYYYGKPMPIPEFEEKYIRSS